MNYSWKSIQDGEKLYWQSRCSDAVGVMYEMGEHLDLAWNLKQVIKNQPASVLDVGIGPMGIGLLWLYPFSPVKIGLDPLQRINVNTGNYYVDSLINTIKKEIIFIQSKGEGLPFRDGSFDLVICNNVLDHSLFPKTIVNELCRVTMKNGHLGIGVDTNSFLGFFVRWIDRRIRTHINAYRLHPHDIIIGTIDNILRKNGFHLLSHNKASFLGRIVGRRRMQWWVAVKD
jgi:SAM-dependent methyltransferase